MVKFFPHRWALEFRVTRHQNSHGDWIIPEIYKYDIWYTMFTFHTKFGTQRTYSKLLKEGVISTNILDTTCEYRVIRKRY